MLNINNITVEDIKFEYMISGINLYVLNTSNNRMIKTSLEMLEYLENYEVSNKENDPDIDKFIFGPKQRKYLDFHIKEFQISKSKFTWLINSLDNKYIGIICKLLIVFGLCFSPYFTNQLISFYISSDIKFDWIMSVGILICQLIITCFHELGHYYYYQKYIHSEKLQMGILLRYIFLPMFYTNVNFMNHLDKKKQVKIITAGVMTQLVVNGLMCLMLLITMNKFILLLFIMNLFNVFMNLIPFLKMDGYWLINILIDSDDYMKSFKNFIFKGQRVKLSEFLLGTLNLVVILLVLILGVNNVLNLISSI